MWLHGTSMLPIKTGKKNKVGQAGQQGAKLLIAVTPVSWFFFIMVLILIAWWSPKAWSGEGKPKLGAIATSEENTENRWK